MRRRRFNGERSFGCGQRTEIIPAGGNGVDGPVVVAPQKFDAVTLVGGPAAFGHGGAGTGGEKDGGGGVGRNGEVKVKPVGEPLPIADNEAADGMVAGADPGHITDGLGVDEDALEAGAGGVAGDAAEVVIEPFHELTEHEVILG